MPNPVSIGKTLIEVARVAAQSSDDIGRILAHEATAILEKSGPKAGSLLPAELINALQKGALREGQLVVAEGKAGELLVVGRPFSHSVAKPTGPSIIYEKGRNITLFPNGEYAIAKPTPSGQKVSLTHFDVKGQPKSLTHYVDSLKDEYDLVREAKSAGSFHQNVITHPDSRQVTLGWHWNFDRTNFLPSDEVVQAIKGSQPVDVSSGLVNRHLGQWVSNPRASGWLIGFDKTAGEALVSTQDFAHAFTWGQRTLPSLKGFYPVELKAFDGSMYQAYRNAAGQLIQAVPEGSVFRIHPSTQVFAYSPFEVGVAQGRLANSLGLTNSRIGLRGLGGFSTDIGGRIPIRIAGA